MGRGSFFVRGAHTTWEKNTNPSFRREINGTYNSVYNLNIFNWAVNCWDTLFPPFPSVQNHCKKSVIVLSMQIPWQLQGYWPQLAPHRTTTGSISVRASFSCSAWIRAWASAVCRQKLTVMGSELDLINLYMLSLNVSSSTDNDSHTLYKMFCFFVL